MKERVKILLCDDDLNLGFLLKEFLTEKNYDVDLYHDGEAGIKAFMTNKYNLCLLDVVMPKKDGFSLAKEIRAVDSNMPIVFLTAKALKEDIITGFKIGADDYITKPFCMEELVFRIDAIIRRSKGKSASLSAVYKIGNFTFHAQRQHLIFDDNITKLTTKESELLGLLAAYPNDVLDRGFALKSIWIDESYFNSRSMDVYITKLRKHLDRDSTVSIINIHGKGYKLVMP